jgi:hypothetical protein
VVGAAAITAAAGGAVMWMPQAPVFGEAVAGPLPQATAQATATATAQATATATAQATATAVSPQPTSVSAQPTPRPVRFYPVDPRFQAYYNLVNGPQTMGSAISPVTNVNGVPAQYFEKARLEDSRTRNQTGDPTYDFEYGLLVDEMAAVRSQRAVGGDRSNVTYATIFVQSNPSLRVPPPAGFTGGDALVLADGSAFIPFTADLSPAPGHNVPPYFWDYMNRLDLFPAGWLHDIGLPTTEPLDAIVDKGRIIGNQIVYVNNVPIKVQSFQRTILTYDPNNPEGFLTERANTGTDYQAVFPDRVPI